MSRVSGTHSAPVLVAILSIKARLTLGNAHPALPATEVLLTASCAAFAVTPTPAYLHVAEFTYPACSHAGLTRTELQHPPRAGSLGRSPRARYSVYEQPRAPYKQQLVSPVCVLSVFSPGLATLDPCHCDTLSHF
ncbi:hypothetical protein HYPSUDRAFT_868721 [Hypholoma sublateritium FD-334 SS-4]|uniref:Uncharacterized protein n=1 Tax=Hypholoma sublateritium (strain FD-334 SS-4) TaxID=945553 RepID=A0A0D2Q7L5_HYPSF|nr:hypothetical protein HYPSUDRAFT_868721 [Hypholoma sublateritium FD-334 SS-4]